MSSGSCQDEVKVKGKRTRRKKRWFSGSVFPEESLNAGLAAGIPSARYINVGEE